MYEESLKSKRDNSSKCLNHFLIPIKGVDGRGHFKTLFISFSRRAKYKNIGKYQKEKFMKLFFINDYLYNYR